MWNFLQCFIGRVRHFTNNFWKILKVLLKKILICEILSFPKFYGLLFVFLFFFIFHILFSISSIYTCQKVIEIFMFFLCYGLQILSKNFEKSWNIFLKNVDFWNPKFIINSIVYYYFYFFSILEIFFSYFTNSNLSKSSKHFCDAFLYGL